jgi:hypothetical protein
LYILTQKAVPFFELRHRRQALGFEGLDMEDKRWNDVEIQALTIPKTDIEEAKEGCYRVRSQSNPETWFIIDLVACHCDCPSFPLISFCKHVAAIQRHFPETLDLVPFDDMPDPAKPEATTEATMPGHNGNFQLDTRHHFSRIGQKILDVASRDRGNQFSHLTPVLLNLEVGLDQAQPALLPKKLNVPPNQHSWPETAAVMAAKPKTKRKTNLDPYGGGERSGKKAKPDARMPR